ncbi:MAG: hypothetical protein GY696_40215 [Gammaproteobacteria bacterium]|nr:hypothetical protein [Gammaproteobacteria bacterium]
MLTSRNRRRTLSLRSNGALDEGRPTALELCDRLEICRRTFRPALKIAAGLKVEVDGGCGSGRPNTLLSSALISGRSCPILIGLEGGGPNVSVLPEFGTGVAIAWGGTSAVPLVLPQNEQNR